MTQCTSNLATTQELRRPIGDQFPSLISGGCCRSSMGAVANSVTYFTDIKRLFGTRVHFDFPVKVAPEKPLANVFGRVMLTALCTLLIVGFVLGLLLFPFGHAGAPLLGGSFLLIGVIFWFTVIGFNFHRSREQKGNPVPAIPNFKRNLLAWAPGKAMMVGVFGTFLFSLVPPPTEVPRWQSALGSFAVIVWFMLYFAATTLGHYVVWLARKQREFEDAGYYSAAKMEELYQVARTLSDTKKGGVFQVEGIRASGPQQSTMVLSQLAGGDKRTSRNVFQAQGVAPDSIVLLDNSATVVAFYPADQARWLFTVAELTDEIEAALTPPKFVMDFAQGAPGPLRGMFPFVMNR